MIRQDSLEIIRRDVMFYPFDDSGLTDADESFGGMFQLCKRDRVRVSGVVYGPRTRVFR